MTDLGYKEHFLYQSVWWIPNHVVVMRAIFNACECIRYDRYS